MSEGKIEGGEREGEEGDGLSWGLLFERMWRAWWVGECGGLSPYFVVREVLTWRFRCGREDSEICKAGNFVVVSSMG